MKGILNDLMMLGAIIVAIVVLGSLPGCGDTTNAPSDPWKNECTVNGATSCRDDTLVRCVNKTWLGWDSCDALGLKCFDETPTDQTVTLAECHECKDNSDCPENTYCQPATDRKPRTCEAP